MAVILTLWAMNSDIRNGLISPVKVTVGLVTGKKLYDKRQDMAERDAKRDIAKRLKEQQKY